MFVMYLEDGHYGSGEVVKICSGCFSIKIKPVMKNKMAVRLTKMFTQCHVRLSKLELNLEL